MCNIISDYTQSEKVSVYKYALKRDNKYFSPATGIEYQIGDVPLLSTLNYKRLDSFFVDLVWKNHHYETPKDVFHTPSYNGYTAGFITLGEAVDMLNNHNDYNIPNNYKAVIIKITLSKDLKNATYHSNDLIAGKHINSIEEIDISELYFLK